MEFAHTYKFIGKKKIEIEQNKEEEKKHIETRQNDEINTNKTLQT